MTSDVVAATIAVDDSTAIASTTERRSTMRPLLITVTAAFSAFTLWVLAQTGLVGFYEQLLGTPAGWQVFADIVIALVLVLAWMWRNAADNGRRFWPYAIVTLTLGSIGPLLYLLLMPSAAHTQGRQALQH
jgi:hypothetical protein